MVNITITIPKKNAQNWLEDIEKFESAKAMILYYKVPNAPKNIHPGDKCYAIIKDRIVGYHLIRAVEWMQQWTCEITGDTFRTGWYISRPSNTWKKFQTPIPQKAHRGFKYLPPDKQRFLDTLERFDKYKRYTYQELQAFQETGVEGKVCNCTAQIMNSMTLECPQCGKILPQYAKNYAKRQNNDS